MQRAMSRRAVSRAATSAAPSPAAMTKVGSPWLERIRDQTVATWQGAGQAADVLFRSSTLPVLCYMRPVSSPTGAITRFSLLTGLSRRRAPEAEQSGAFGALDAWEEEEEADEAAARRVLRALPREEDEDFEREFAVLMGGSSQVCIVT